MDWSREWFSIRAALLLPAVVAVLSFATGVANIATPIEGALGLPIPEGFQQAAGFTGALTGFTLLLAVFGLRRRLRLGWYLTVVLLPVSGLQGVVQSSPVSAPLVVLSVVSIPTLLVNHHRFDRSLDLSTAQLAAGAALLGAQVYGTVGTWALREEFTNVSTLTAAFYYTLVTASTVGYGDVTPTVSGRRCLVCRSSCSGRPVSPSPWGPCLARPSKNASRRHSAT